MWNVKMGQNCFHFQEQTMMRYKVSAVLKLSSFIINITTLLKCFNESDDSPQKEWLIFRKPYFPKCKYFNKKK